MVVVFVVVVVVCWDCRVDVPPAAVLPKLVDA